MGTITTKYSIGDAVFHASITTERKQHPCPDCKGTRRWKALSPAGGEYEFDCPRCSGSYRSNADMSLDYSASVPSVRKLTIGSVQYNSAPSSYDHGARYMCLETGVGSGQVYNEGDLFGSEQEAMVAATAKANLANATTKWIVKQYDQSLDISDYQIDSAAMKLAREEKSRARSMLWSLNYLFDKIADAEGKDEIIEAVEDYKTYDWSRDKAAVNSDEDAA